MTLPKPERVEVGQWWGPCCDGDAWRIEPEHLEPKDPPDPMDGGWTWLIESHVYLGSGERPEPSEWMIETLAGVLRDVQSVISVNGAPVRYDNSVRAILAGTQVYDSGQKRLVASVYNLLRSLGKR